MNIKEFVENYITIGYTTVGKCLVEYHEENIDFTEHFDIETLYDILLCSKCNKSFPITTTQDIINHIKQYHPEVEP